MFKKLNKKNQKGFTLVELLVVIAIIGILAVVAVPSLFSQIEKSKAADITATIDTIKTASTAYYADKGDAPEIIKDLNDKKYLDADPSTGDVKYAIEAIDSEEKTAKLNVTMPKTYMTNKSRLKLEKDLGLDVGTISGTDKSGDTVEFTIKLIEHVEAD